MSMGLGTAVAYLTLNGTGFAAGIDAAIADANRLNTGFNNVTNTATRVGGAMAGLGMILTAGLTAPVIGFGAASIKSGAEFDKTMSDVKAVSMTTKTDMDKLAKAGEEMGISYKKGSSDTETAFNAMRAAAIKMGNDTKFTAKESADALYYMGLAGWSADQMIAGLPSVLSLAAAGNLDLAKTSDIVTDNITAFGHSASDTATVGVGQYTRQIDYATRFTDIMASAMSNSNTDVEMLGESFKYVAPVAGSFGYSAEDVTIALGLMANAGLKASQAGTALRQGMKRLVAPNEKAAAAMQKYGISAFDAEGKTKPLRQQLTDLRGVFGNLDVDVKKADGSLKSSEEIMQEYGKKLPTSDMERLQDAVDVFGTTALPGMLAIMGASNDSFDRLTEAVDNSSNAFVMHNGEIMTYDQAVKQFGEEVVNTSSAFEIMGAAEGMAAIQLDNLAGDWTLFKSALGTTKQIISDMANGALRDFVQGLTDLVRKFNEADPATQKTIAKFALMAASIGPILLVVGKLVSFFGKLAGTFNVVANAFSFLTGQITALCAHMGTLFGIFRNLYAVAGGGLPGVLAVLQGAFAALTAPVSLAVIAIGTLVSAFVTLMATNEEFRNKVIGAFSSVASTLSSAGQQIVEAVNSIGFNFKDVADLIKGAWMGLSSVLAPVLMTIVQTIANQLNAAIHIVTGFVQVFSGIIGLLKGFATGDMQQIKTSFDQVVKGIGNAFQGLLGLAMSPLNMLFTFINEVFGTNIPNTMNEWASFVQGIISNVAGFFQSLPGVISGVFNSIVSTVSGWADSIGQFFSELPSKITSALSALPGQIGNVFGTVYGTIVTWRAQIIANAIEAGANFVSSFVSGFMSLPGKIGDFLTQVDESAAKFASEFPQKAKEAAENFVKNLISGFKGVGDKVNGFFDEIKNDYDKGAQEVEKANKKISESGKTTTKDMSENQVNLSDTFGKMGTGIGEFAKGAVDKFKEFGQGFKDGFVDSLSNADPTTKAAFANLASSVQSFQATWTNVWNGVKNAIDNHFIQPISQLPAKATEQLNLIIQGISQFVTNCVQALSMFGMNLLTTVQSGFESFKMYITNGFNSIVETARTWVTNMVTAAAQFDSQFISSIQNGFSNLASVISNSLSSSISAVTSWVSSVISSARQVGTQFVTNVKAGFDKAKSTIKSVLTSILSSVKTFASNVASQAKQAGSKFTSSIKSGFDKAKSAAKSALTSITSTVKSFASKVASSAKQAGTQFANSIKSGFQKALQAVKSVVKSIASAITGSTKSVANAGKNIANGLINGIMSIAKVPSMIRVWLSSAISTVGAWAGQMASRAAQAGSQFLSGIASTISQVPGRIGSALSSAISRVAAFASQMGSRARSAGNNFKNGIVNAVQTIPGQMASIGANICSSLAGAISSGASSVIGAAVSMAQQAIAAAKSALGIASPSKVFMSIGANVVLGLQSGIQKNSGLIKKAATLMVDGLVDTLTKEYKNKYNKAYAEWQSWEKKVAKAKSKVAKAKSSKQKKKWKKKLEQRKKNRDKAKEYYQNVMSDYISYADKYLAQEQKLYNISDKQVVQYWKKIRDAAKKGTKAWKEANEKYIEAQIERQANQVQVWENSLSKYKDLHDTSIQQEVKYWKEKLKHVKKGSKQYEEVLFNYNKAVKEKQDAFISGKEEVLEKLKSQHDMTVGDEIRFWQKILKELKKKHPEYVAQYKQVVDTIVSLRKQMNDEIADADKTLKEGFEDVSKSLKENIVGVFSSYNEAVASVKETLMGLTGLFDKFEMEQGKSTDELMSNLESQVLSLEQWDATVDAIYSKNLPTDLVDQLVAMGPTAMNSINALLSMSDEQLNRYIELWERKGALAGQTAAKVVDTTPYVNQVNAYISEAISGMNKYADEYNETIKSITGVASKTIKSKVQEFASTLNQTLIDSFGRINYLFDFIDDDKFYKGVQPVTDKLGNLIGTQLDESILQALTKVEEKATDAAEDVAGTVVTTISEGIESNNIEETVYTGYYDVGVNIVGNVQSGAEDSYDKLNTSVNDEGKEASNNLARGALAQVGYVKSSGYEVGKQVDLGIVNGINDYVGHIAAAAAAAVRAAVAAARAEAGIASPSKAMANEVGKWLPLGMAKGFVDATPQAAKQMQGAIDDSLDSLEAKPIDIMLSFKSTSDGIIDAFVDASDKFADVANSVVILTDFVKENMQNIIDITDGMLYNINEEDFSTRVATNTTTSIPVNKNIGTNGTQSVFDSGNTFVFNSPKPIDEVEASRLLRQTSRDLAQGFA